MSTSCQSKVTVSTVFGKYQKLSVPPPAGTAMVWYMELSPIGSGPLRFPRKAEKVPLFACAVEITGGPLTSRITHGENVPVSKPPLTMESVPQGDAEGEGEGAIDGVAEGAIDGVAEGAIDGVADGQPPPLPASKDTSSTT